MFWLLQVLFSKFVGDANVGQATLFLTCLGNGDDVAEGVVMRVVILMMWMRSIVMAMVGGDSNGMIRKWWRRKRLRL